MGELSVSVVIPTYNDARNVSRAVGSALRQVPAPKEVIVVDDGSSDDTKDVLGKFGSDIVYIRIANGGAGAARNLGVHEASGEWIAFLDSDDEWLTGKLALQIDLLSRCPSTVSVVYGQMRDVDPDGRVLDTWPMRVATSAQDMSVVPYWAGLDMFPPTSTVLARRTSLLEAGLFAEDIRTAEDLDLWVRMEPAGRFVGLHQVVANRFVRPVGLTKSTDAVIQYRRYLQVLSRRRAVMEPWAGQALLRGGESYIHASLANASRISGNRWSSILHAGLGMLHHNVQRPLASKLFLEGCLGSAFYNGLVSVWRRLGRPSLSERKQ